MYCPFMDDQTTVSRACAEYLRCPTKAASLPSSFCIHRLLLVGASTALWFDASYCGRWELSSTAHQGASSYPRVAPARPGFLNSTLPLRKYLQHSRPNEQQRPLAASTSYARHAVALSAVGRVWREKSSIILLLLLLLLCGEHRWLAEPGASSPSTPMTAGASRP